MENVLFLLVGLGVGFAVAWIVRGARATPVDTRVENELREQLRLRETELAAVRDEAASASAKRASSDTAREGAERTLAEVRQSLIEATADVAKWRQKHDDSIAQIAAIQADLRGRQAAVVELNATLAEIKEGRGRDAETAATAVAKADAEARSLQESIAKISAELATAQAQLQAERQTLSDIRMQRENLTSERNGLQEQRITLTNRNGELESQVKYLNERLASEKKQAEAAIEEITSALRESKEVRREETSKAGAASELASERIRTLQGKVSEIGAELATAQAQLQAERRTAGELRIERDALVVERNSLQEQRIALTNRNGELESQIKFLDERIASERLNIESLQERFRKEFESISNKLLVENAAKFGQQSSESLDKLLSPLRENLTQFKASLDTTRTEAAAQNAVLKDSIARIGADAANLAKALKGDVKLLGNWGEAMLDQLLEKSGLQRDVHYRRQSGRKDIDGEQRFLDVVVDLPEKRHLVIDSKVSLKSFEEYHNAADEKVRTEFLERHVESIRRHFRDLGEKNYHEIHGISTPDFVLMYIPIESAYFAAIAHEPGLFAEAFERRVVLITNSTLLATLRTVANVWRLADQQKNALEIADRGGKLYDKFVGFVDDLADIGKALDTAQRAFGAANTKLHSGTGNLVRQAEQMRILGAKASKALPAVLIEKAGGPEQILLSEETGNGAN